MPFYKPAAALAVFERMVRQVDIPTGEEGNLGYVSVGPERSRYRNDPATVQEEVLDAGCGFVEKTNLPVRPEDGAGRRRGGGGGGGDRDGVGGGGSEVEDLFCDLFLVP